MSPADPMIRAKKKSKISCIPGEEDLIKDRNKKKAMGSIVNAPTNDMLACRQSLKENLNVCCITNLIQRMDFDQCRIPLL